MHLLISKWAFLPPCLSHYSSLAEVRINRHQHTPVYIVCVFVCVCVCVYVCACVFMKKVCGVCFAIFRKQVCSRPVSGRIRAAVDICHSHSQPHATQQQIDTEFKKMSPCVSSKPHHRGFLGCGAVAGDMCGKSSIRPCCSQSLLGQQLVQTSGEKKKADGVELSD